MHAHCFKHFSGAHFEGKYFIGTFLRRNSDPGGYSSGNFYGSEIRPRIFLGFDFCPHSISPVTRNPEYPTPWEIPCLRFAFFQILSRLFQLAQMFCSFGIVFLELNHS